jgi:hypothetical protein
MGNTRLATCLLLLAASWGVHAQPPEYRFDLTVEVDAADGIDVIDTVPAGKRQVLRVNSSLHFEISAPEADGLATVVRLVDTSGLEPRVLHEESRDWPASIKREARYELCDGRLVQVMTAKEDATGPTQITFEPIGDQTAKCKSYRQERLTRPPAEWRTLADISDFLAAIRSAGSVTVYEGLPHQTRENALYRRELERADVIRIENFPFYAAPLAMSSRDVSRVTRIALSGDAHTRYRGPSVYGAYHPDYAVVWQNGGEKSGALICFGCHEVIYFTPRGRLIENLGEIAYQDFRTLLSRHRVNRPKRRM